MIETLMLFALGFLTARLLAVVASRLSTVSRNVSPFRIEALRPLSIQIQVDKGQLRASPRSLNR
jgi:hypothetical protein